jgi:putative tricarboxylic transport membrane protein
VDGIDAPTLKESGLDVEVQNWRMVAAGPDLSDEQKADLVATVEQMAGSEQWKATLASKGWLDTFLAGDEFASYINQEVEGTTQVLKDIGVVK